MNVASTRSVSTFIQRQSQLMQAYLGNHPYVPLPNARTTISRLLSKRDRSKARKRSLRRFSTHRWSPRSGPLNLSSLVPADRR